MAENVNYPKVLLKKKQISILVDFCLEESIEFSVKQQNFPETDWEVELKIKDVKTGIIVGMFLRENRFEIEGFDQQKIKKTTAKKAEEKPEHAAKPKQENEESNSPTLM